MSWESDVQARLERLEQRQRELEEIVSLLARAAGRQVGADDDDDDDEDEEED